MRSLSASPCRPRLLRLFTTWAVWATLATLVLPATGQGARTLTPPRYAEVIEDARAMVTAHIAEENLPGMAIAVAVEGEMVWSEGFGFAHLEHRTPIWPTSRFRIGSISKPLTAAAAAQLYAEGQLDPDAPVQQYVPTFPEKDHPLTTRHLGAHLGGIRHYRNIEFLSDVHYPTVAEGLTIFQDDDLIHPPGTRYAYSSYGWNLISAVIEGAAGQPFLAYMDDHVFGPLGMVHTVPDYNRAIIPQRVGFYEHNEDGQLQNTPYVDNSYKWAGGGFLSTTEDLLRFGHAHLSGDFLPEGASALLFTEQRTNDGEGVGYGFGWRLYADAQGRALIGHGGGSVGGTSILVMQPDTEVVLVALVNLSGANLSVTQQILTAFIDAAEAQ